MKKILILISLIISLTITSYADEIYIGRWEWNTLQQEFNYWEAPQSEFLTGVIDLRNINQMSQQGGSPQGWALFSYSQAVSSPNLFNIESRLDRKLNNPTLSKIENELGIVLTSNTIREVIWEILTLHGDATGLLRWKPLMPDANGRLEVRFGSDGIIKQSKLIPFISPEWESVLSVLHENYRMMLKTETHNKIARVLDYWEEKYGVHYSTFIPDDIIMIVSLPHETTFTESFNTADSNTLGPDLTWVEVDGDWDIVSNKASAGGASHNNARAEHDLSGSDHYSQADVTHAGSGDAGVLARFSSSADTSYLFIFTNAGSAYILYKNITGSYTSLQTAGGSAPTDDTFKIEVDGSSLEGFVNSSSVISVTDTAITGNTRCGIRSFNISHTIDNFETADLISAVTTSRIYIF